ncbi:MAG: hypothetical protein AAF710_11090 [Planctomycetota bacterium]
MRAWTTWAVAAALVCGSAHGQFRVPGITPADAASFEASRDAEAVTLAGADSWARIETQQPDEAETLARFHWPAGAFPVTLREAPGREWDREVAFASPRPMGDAAVDRVTLRWYRPEAKPESAPPQLPGVLVVHSLHPDLPVATLLARGLRARGVHAFVIELPGYAGRKPAASRMNGVTALVRAPQAVADIRRARDAIAALAASPDARLDAERIAVQGTSLGSFFAAAAAALDGGFDHTFLLLSGGDGVEVLERGEKDAHALRGALRHYGYRGAALRDLIDPIEPLRLAHRLDPDTTWMFNARDDVVIPPANARKLADAVGLDPSHHLWLAGNHYTSFLLLPGVLHTMCDTLDDTPPE